MKSPIHATRGRLSFALLASLVTGAAAVGLFACFEDFKVLPPETDAGLTSDGGPPITTDGSIPPTDSGGNLDAGPDAPPPKTHCDSVAPPPGVVASDFLCADFDRLKLEVGFNSFSQNDGGTLARVTDPVVSSPNALLSGARGIGGQGNLSWRPLGSKALIEATTHVQINPTELGGVAPPANGLLELMHMTTTNASVTFGYSRGAFVETPNYYGYFVASAAFGGAAAITYKQLPGTGQLTPKIWTDVKIVWAVPTGSVIVLYNNIKIFSESMFSSNDTSLTFRLGAYASGDVGVMPQFHFDDAELSVRR